MKNSLMWESPATIEGGLAKIRVKLTSMWVLLAAVVLLLVYDELFERLQKPIYSVIEKNAYNKNLIELLFFALITIGTLLIAKVFQKNSWHELGFVKKGWLKEYGIGWVLGAAMLVVSVLIMWALGGVKIVGFQFNARLLVRFIPIVIAWCIQGNAEEVLSRSWIGNHISRKNSVVVGIIVSATFFMAMHLGNDNMGILPVLDLFLFGIFAYLFMMKRGNIWAPSGFHTAWNCFQGNIFNFPVSGTPTGDAFILVKTQGNTVISGGEFGVEGSIVSVIVQLVIILWLIYDIFVKNRKAVM